MEPTEKQLRKQLVELLDGENAHVSFAKAVGGLPAKLRGATPAGFPHSPWQIVEHLRIAQWDILEFSRNPGHVSPEWPGGYWPGAAPPNPRAWAKSVAAFRADLDSLKKLVIKPSTDLYARIPWGTGQTILREILLATDHNAYHVGQLVLVRRLLGAWKQE